MALLMALSGGTNLTNPVSAAAPPAVGPSLTGVLVFQTVSGGAIYVVNADGSSLRQLTTGIDPVLSPDGRQVAFTRWDNDQHGGLGSVWVINLDGSGERQVLGEVAQPKSPAWSPLADGNPNEARLVISAQSGGRLAKVSKCVGFNGDRPPAVPPDAYDIKVKIDQSGEPQLCYDLPPNPQWGLRMIDVATGSFQDLPRDIFSYSPTWDPVNAWRVIYKGDLGLVSLDINRGVTWALTRDRYDHTPAFSPDGAHIAVSYWQHDHWELHTLNADGSGRRRLTETPLRVLVELRMKGLPERSWNNAAPVWSPDGAQIAFLTDRGGAWEIWAMGADGGNQRPLFPPGTLAGLTLQYYGVDEHMLSWR
jgi:hypothetical protein